MLRLGDGWLVQMNPIAPFRFTCADFSIFGKLKEMGMQSEAAQ
jgi:hypothetical protein